MVSCCLQVAGGGPIFSKGCHFSQVKAECEKYPLTTKYKQITDKQLDSNVFSVTVVYKCFFVETALPTMHRPDAILHAV